MATENKQRVIRIHHNTGKLLDGMSQKSMDAAIQKIWSRVLEQGKLLKEWKDATGCSTPTQYLKQELMKQNAED